MTELQPPLSGPGNIADIGEIPADLVEQTVLKIKTEERDNLWLEEVEDE